MLGLCGVGVVSVLHKWCVLGPLAVIGYESCQRVDRGDLAVGVMERRGKCGDGPIT